MQTGSGLEHTTVPVQTARRNGLGVGPETTVARADSFISELEIICQEVASEPAHLWQSLRKIGYGFW